MVFPKPSTNDSAAMLSSGRSSLTDSREEFVDGGEYKHMDAAAAAAAARHTLRSAASFADGYRDLSHKSDQSATPAVPPKKAGLWRMFSCMGKTKEPVRMTTRDLRISPPAPLPPTETPVVAEKDKQKMLLVPPPRNPLRTARSATRDPADNIRPSTPLDKHEEPPPVPPLPAKAESRDMAQETSSIEVRPSFSLSFITPQQSANMILSQLPSHLAFHPALRHEISFSQTSNARAHTYSIFPSPYTTPPRSATSQRTSSDLGTPSLPRASGELVHTNATAKRTAAATPRLTSERIEQILAAIDAVETPAVPPQLATPLRIQTSPLPVPQTPSSTIHPAHHPSLSTSSTTSATPPILARKTTTTSTCPSTPALSPSSRSASPPGDTSGSTSPTTTTTPHTPNSITQPKRNHIAFSARTTSSSGTSTSTRSGRASRKPPTHHMATASARLTPRQSKQLAGPNALLGPRPPRKASAHVEGWAAVSPPSSAASARSTRSTRLASSSSSASSAAAPPTPPHTLLRASVAYSASIYSCDDGGVRAPRHKASEMSLGIVGGSAEAQAQGYQHLLVRQIYERLAVEGMAMRFRCGEGRRVGAGGEDIWALPALPPVGVAG